MLNNIAALMGGAAAAVATDYESIATVTLGSSAAQANFTSIATTYSHLQLRVSYMPTNGTNGTYAQIYVGNGSADTGANYARHQLVGNGSSASAGAAASTNYIFQGPAYSSNSNSNPCVMIIDLLDYANTNKYKTARILAGNDSNGAGSVDFDSGLWMNTSAINNISVRAFSMGSASNFGQYSSFALYGIK